MFISHEWLLVIHAIMVTIHDKQNGALPQRQIILKGSTRRVAVKAEPRKKTNQAHAAWRIRTLRHCFLSTREGNAVDFSSLQAYALFEHLPRRAAPLRYLLEYMEIFSTELLSNQDHVELRHRTNLRLTRAPRRLRPF